MTVSGKEITAERLAALFDEHREGLAGAVRGVLGPGSDPQEILQDAFLRALRARERGIAPRDPKAWIFVITLNAARDAGRRRRRAPSAALEEVDAMALIARDRSPHGKLESAEAVVAARAAIQRLRNKEKEVFLLRVSGDLSFDAIGEALSIPVGTAKTRMRRALMQLRSALSDHAPLAQRRTNS